MVNIRFGWYQSKMFAACLTKCRPTYAFLTMNEIQLRAIPRQQDSAQNARTAVSLIYLFDCISSASHTITPSLKYEKFILVKVDF